MMSGMDVSAIVEDQLRRLDQAVFAEKGFLTKQDLLEELAARDKKLEELIDDTAERERLELQSVIDANTIALDENQRYMQWLVDKFDGPAAEVEHEREHPPSPPQDPAARRSLFSGFGGPAPPAPYSDNCTFRGSPVNVAPVGPPPGSQTQGTPVMSNKSDSGGVPPIVPPSAPTEAPSAAPTRVPPPNPYQRAPTPSPTAPTSAWSPSPRPVVNVNSNSVVATSPLQDPHNGERYSRYLCGTLGLASGDQVTTDFLRSIGFGDDLHDEIINSVGRLLYDWKQPTVHPKYVDALKKLEDLQAVLFVDWFQHLRFDLVRYNVGLMPFDAIQLSWKNVGLCPPGVGEYRYSPMSEALYSILCILLPSHPIVDECKHALVGFQHDGYKLLWNIMCRFMPVFNPSLAPLPPRWEDYKNVSELGKVLLLYFRLMIKKGAQFNQFERSLMLLDTISEHSMLGITTSLKCTIEAIRESTPDFDRDWVSLPTHLQMSGIIDTLSKLCSPVDSSMCLTSALTLSRPTMNRTATVPDIQGAQLGAQLHSTARSPPSRPAPNRRGGRRAPPPRTRRPSNPPSDPNVVCRSCLKRGHEEVLCRDLAKLLILSKRVETLPTSVKNKVMAAYRERYGTPATPQAHLTFAKQLADICAERNITEDDLVNHMDWDHFINCTARMSLDEDENEEEFFDPQEETSE